MPDIAGASAPAVTAGCARHARLPGCTRTLQHVEPCLHFWGSASRAALLCLATHADVQSTAGPQAITEERPALPLAPALAPVVAPALVALAPALAPVAAATLSAVQPVADALAAAAPLAAAPAAADAAAAPAPGPSGLTVAQQKDLAELAEHDPEAASLQAQARAPGARRARAGPGRARARRRPRGGQLHRCTRQADMPCGPPCRMSGPPG